MFVSFFRFCHTYFDTVGGSPVHTGKLCRQWIADWDVHLLVLKLVVALLGEMQKLKTWDDNYKRVLFPEEKKENKCSFIPITPYLLIDWLIDYSFNSLGSAQFSAKEMGQSCLAMRRSMDHASNMVLARIQAQVPEVGSWARYHLTTQLPYIICWMSSCVSYSTVGQITAFNFKQIPLF